MQLEFNIKENIYLRDFLRKQGISRRMGRKIKSQGVILVNSMPAYFSTFLKPGDHLILRYKEEVNNNIPIVKRPINIIYEDDAILVLMKPKNLAIQPSRKHLEDNLIGRVLYYYQQKGYTYNAHIVNRLDFATSGLMIVAKMGYIHHLLASSKITRKYLAKVKGNLSGTGTIDLGIARDPNHSIKRMVTSNGKHALTKYRTLKHNDNYSLLELKIITGRTHQIRVHLSALGHPIIGDKLYGDGGNRLMLHSYYLSFFHPFQKNRMRFINYPIW